MRSFSGALATVGVTALALAAPGTALHAQGAVKYRDASGQWIFTDRAPDGAGRAIEPLHLPHESEATLIAVKRADDGEVTRLLATNHCLCVVSVRALVEQTTLEGVQAGSRYQSVLAADETAALFEAHVGAGAAATLRYRWSATLGSPEAQHHPTQPYRAPFALGATFMVSQAYPAHITHTGPDSRYAIDIAMPDGTPVYAARAGLVINLRHDSFLGAIDPALLDQANVVEILHDDGTIAVYAHLHWDSIRVHVGQHVACGEYIADSGNTGFTSGPHLHFAVWRNSRLGEIAVPVTFAGLGGAPVTPGTAIALTAY